MSDNNIDPQLLRELTEGMKKLAESFANGTKQGDKAAQAMQDLRKKLETGEDQFDSLARSVRRGERTWATSTNTILDLEEQLKKLKDVVEGSEEAEKKARLQKEISVAKGQATSELETKRFWDATQSIVGGLTSFAAGATKAVIGGYQSNASAFQVAGEVLNAGLDATNSTVQGFGKAIATAAPGLAALGPEGLAAGAAIAAVTEGIISFYDKTTQTAKFVNNTLVKEMDNTIKSFGEATSAGALFADGLTEMRFSASLAMLTQNEFSKIIANNSEAFAEFGGSVNAGIKRFTEVNAKMGPFRDGLLNLGYSITDIADGTADYMNILARTGALQGKTDQELAAGTDRYLTNLKAIADYTGEDVKRAKARAEAASLQLAVQAKLYKDSTVNGQLDKNLLAENMQKFRNIISTLGPGSEKAAGQLYTLGTVTGETAVAFGQTPALANKYNDAIGLMSDRSVDAEGVISRIQESGKKYSDAIIQQGVVAGDGIGIANQYNNSLSEANQVVQTGLQMAYKDQGIHQDTVEDAKKAKATQDDLTASYREATISFQTLKKNIQTELEDPMRHFGKVARSVIDQLEQIIADLPGTAASNKKAEEKQQQLEGQGETLPAPAGPAGGTGAGPGTVLPRGQITPELQGILPSLVASLGKPTSLNDGEHASDSRHYNGKAADFSVKGLSPAEVVGKLSAIKNIKGVNADRTWLENGPDNEEDRAWAKSIESAGGQVSKYRGSAPHFHVEALGKGGITNGLSIAGESGPEAVIPLPDGRNIPVKVDVGELVSKMDDLLTVMKDHRDTSNKILHATI